MEMSEFIQQQIQKLVNIHETRNPFLIAKEKDILILKEDLGEVYGYYNKINRIKMIHLNNLFSDERQLFTCAHELCHALIHQDENTPKLSKQTIVSEWKVEKEANYFATQLLIDGSHLEHYIDTTDKIINFYGLPEEMKKYI
ncbi:TPA_asm: ImmA/IrrE family metallo-endopeptidase [Listeria monocytogenes]|uniref:ImmA/IrrE family metallo-endopeptidase n=1 Tax=Listeria monocytogenes TaxID=1639 RepID=UPI00176BC6AC|nr:ImmA/IrrE family metallo-endopeptidase [Listeria monocytogenes]EAE6375071.1 ImmA/IrrE family metallo-endopeptidase [Listeria monocytogenes]EAE6389989.1 ImmA/IrrE family metallo-endopeptidase [Listeria monocytogenes]EAF9157071.1 ImmA/IrrE family metallo-endopeptidase [Listeria monocytogenes]EKL6031348.1 ImmA/IrrE family metallo-endopeptidase [Listeria monocytogenes]MCI2546306.1 ImmA/IrrE family metallo-endopeptidase [Listeria monocytogenes]